MDTNETPALDRDEAVRYVDMHAVADFIGELGETSPTQTVYTSLKLALRDPARAARLLTALDSQLDALYGEAERPDDGTDEGISKFLDHWTTLEADPFEVGAKTKDRYEKAVPAAREARAFLQALARMAAESPTGEVTIPLGPPTEKGLVN